MDLESLAGFASNAGFPCVLLSTVREEIDAGLSAAVVDAYPAVRPHKLLQYEKSATARLERIWPDFQFVAPKSDPQDIIELRALFKATRRTSRTS